MGTYTKKGTAPDWLHDAVDKALFSKIKHEEKEGHSKHYSAIFHDLEPETVADIAKSSNYEAFCETRVASEVKYEIAANW